MKKVMKLSIMILVIFMIIFSTFVSYYHVDGFSVENMTGGQSTGGAWRNVGNKAITVVTSVGTVISIVALIVLGIKYMMGSVEEKAQYKKTLLPYVIGAFCVFAASTIASVIYNIAINLGV